jgi:DNA phosphorothioation-dependent restriction protein DptH
MPKRVTESQRKSILALLAKGQDRQTIAASTGVTVGQVSALAAHVTMGTYGSLSQPTDGLIQTDKPHVMTTSNALAELRTLESFTNHQTAEKLVPVGAEVETGMPICWNPYPENGSANPHVLIIGESGFGKTYATACLIAELTRQGLPSVVFDYGQGFTAETTPRAFFEWTKPIEVRASQAGIAINPLQIFPSDQHGPLNVAQRIADTFAHVYSQIGVQQHAVLRQAVLDVLADQAISPDAPDTWEKPLPAFRAIEAKLANYANTVGNSQRRLAASVAAHISTVFVFNTFRSNADFLNWLEIVGPGRPPYIVRLSGLEHSLERVVTELLLWNMIGFIEAQGPGPLRCFVVLDEAHKLSFAAGSPVEKLLREGRKFGIGVILASQQPEDFSSVAFANTATKLVFQVGDSSGTISRQLHRKVRNASTVSEIEDVITKLPRGHAYFVSENVGRIARIETFEEREVRWRQ